jgi:oligopeptide/dipeptide ABC transporter ATP-binding protein
MYGGRVVEAGRTTEVFTRPAHHYTAALLRSVPSVATVGHRPQGIPGAPPPAVADGQCSFAPRCAAATDRCRTVLPALSGDNGRLVACHYPVGTWEPEAEGAPRHG